MEKQPEIRFYRKFQYILVSEEILFARVCTQEVSMFNIGGTVHYIVKVSGLKLFIHKLFTTGCQLLFRLEMSSCAENRF